MIQTKRETPKEEKEKSLEEIVKDQSVEIEGLKKVIDDMILNGGAL